MKKRMILIGLMGLLFLMAVLHLGARLWVGVVEYQNQRLLEKVKSKNLDMEFERLNNSIDQAITDAGTNFLFLPKPTVEWMNDAVWYYTNTMANDVERNKADPQTNGWYVKTVIITNTVQPVYFMAGENTIELGARDDGVVVWRKKK